MTITPFQIYLWGIADNVSKGFGVAVALCVIGAIISIGMHFGEGHPQGLKFLRAFVAGAVVFGLLAVLTPSSKTIAAMHILPAITNSSVVQRDMPEAYALAKQFLMEKLTKKDE